MIPFYLKKWYLDLTADDGTVMYIYFMATRIAGVAWGNVSAHIRLADGTSSSANLNRKVKLLDGGKSAACDRSFLLNTDGSCHAHLEFPQLSMDLNYRSSGKSWTPADHGVLLTREDGLLTWQVPFPAAAVEGIVKIGTQQRRITGLGYQDVVEMTLAPWHLPVAELTWGRAHCGAGTVVFDQLRLTDGTCPKYLLLRAEDGSFGPAESGIFAITTGAGDCEFTLRHAAFTLRLTRKHVLAEGAIAEGGQIPSRLVRRFLARVSGNPVEKKMISDAELIVGTRVLLGPAIHERVLWDWKNRP